MNERDEREFPEVERREPEESTHVTLDRVSQALDSRISRLEAAFERAIDAATRVLKWIVTLVGLLVAGAFGVGGYVMFQDHQIEQRPTRAVIERMIEEKTAEKFDALTDEIAQIKAGVRVSRDASTQGMVALQLSVEALQEQASSIRRDYERAHGRGQ